MQPYYRFPVEEGVQQRFSDPAFVEERGSDRAVTPGSYWNSREAQRLAMATQGAAFQAENSIYELGADGVQPFLHVTHSTDVTLYR